MLERLRIANASEGEEEFSWLENSTNGLFLRCENEVATHSAWRWNPIHRRLRKCRTKKRDVCKGGEKKILEAVSADSLERIDAHF